MEYQLNEIFCSLQGEGVWTGTPMVFIRLAGCSMGCKFCDTDLGENFRADETEIIHRVKQYKKVRIVVLTGGEPLEQDCGTLIRLLHLEGYHVHLETNGFWKVPSSSMGEIPDWITVSPKSTDLDGEIIQLADETKFLCGQPGWVELIEEVMSVYSPYRAERLWIMPVADGRQINWQNVELAKAYCLANPDFSLCMQLHKILKIP